MPLFLTNICLCDQEYNFFYYHIPLCVMWKVNYGKLSKFGIYSCIFLSVWIILGLTILLTLATKWPKVYFEFCLNKFLQNLEFSGLKILEGEKQIFSGNQTKARISKRVFQKNKVDQIFLKTNISYPLIQTRTYQGVRNLSF